MSVGGRVGLRAGLDIGGTSTVAVLLDTEGAPLAHHTARSGRGPTAVVDVAVAAVGRLCDVAGVSPAALRGVGVGLPGPDGGGGIPEEDLPRVFDTGWRGSDARTPPAGAGLGLAIVRGIVEAHRGRADVRTVDGGCRFEVTLPLAG